MRSVVRVTRVAGVLLALAVIAGAGWLIVLGVEKEPALVGSLLTAASAVVAVSVSRGMEKRAELRQLHRQQMLPLYTELITRARTVDPDVDQATAFWKDLSTKLTLYGPPSVIKAQLALSRRLATTDDLSVPDPMTMLLVEKLYRAMRADLRTSPRPRTSDCC